MRKRLIARKEHTLQVVDFREMPSPLLVMPYFPLGNLEHVHSESPIAVEETVEILFQALKALGYLHPRGVAHRDLKPENILVGSRYPFNIKMADFGLANDKSDLETSCGTRLYAAPEIYGKTKYTTAVDLWSLGVIVLQYVYGLPRAVRERRGRHKDDRSMIEEWALAWCRRIVDHANDWDSDGLIELLTIGMLRFNPEERLSAGACLKKGYDLALFKDHPLDSGSATSTRQTALQGEISDDDDSTTIVLGALWATEAISDHNNNGRIGCCSPGHASMLLKPCTTQALSASSNGDGRRPRRGGFETAPAQWDGNIQAPVDVPTCPLEARSTYPAANKRERSPAGGSAKHSSREPIKRRQPDVRLAGKSVLHTYDLSD